MCCYIANSIAKVAEAVKTNEKRIEQNIDCLITKSIIIIIIIKCMWSRCRRDDIHVCFAYASPQRMPHM